MPIFSIIDPSKSVIHSNTSNPQQVNNTATTPHVTAPQKSVVAEPANRPTTIRRASGRGAYSTPSILDALRDEPKSNETNIVSDVTTNTYSKNETSHPFSQQELLEVWKIFVDKIDDAPQLKSALGTREPRISGEWQIEYDVDTDLQLNRLALDIKPKLQSYLRNHFGNEAIEVQFIVSASTDQKIHIPYTDAERWALLVEKYPPLATLKSKFGLDFEHF